MNVKVYIYPEIDGEECEFQATARVTFGAPARRYGPPELCSPGDPTEVEWLTFVGEGRAFTSLDAFDAWLRSKEARFDLVAYEDAAIEKASQDDDCDDWRDVG